MANPTGTTAQPGAAIPPDDANRKLTVANPEDPKMRHISVAGGTYTILVTGDDTGGRYCLIDMLVPPGGGPPLMQRLEWFKSLLELALLLLAVPWVLIRILRHPGKGLRDLGEGHFG